MAPVPPPPIPPMPPGPCIIQGFRNPLPSLELSHGLPVLIVCWSSWACRLREVTPLAAISLYQDVTNGAPRKLQRIVTHILAQRGIWTPKSQQHAVAAMIGNAWWSSTPNFNNPTKPMTESVGAQPDHMPDQVHMLDLGCRPAPARSARDQGLHMEE